MPSITRQLPVLSYILRRVLYTVPIALGVTIFVFALIHLSGDPINAVVAPDATAETVAKLKKDYGFDKPLPLQYLLWLGKALHGDFGYSIVNSRPVLATLLLAVPNTLILACCATLIGFTLGALLGGLAGFYQGRLVDKLATGLGIAGVSVPHYWLGMVLVIVFAVELQLLPATGMGPGGSSGWEWDWLHIKHLVLLAVMGLQLGYLLGGSILVETVFNWPGTGFLLNDAIFRRDIPMLQGTILLLSMFFVVLNLIVDIVQTMVDPRMRRS